jgi:small subunit ribosomal protein S6
MHARPYEAVYILPGSHSTEDINAAIAKFKDIVERNGGAVDSAELWQKRRLAYEIGDHRDGNYVIMKFSAPAEVPHELSRLLDIADEVIRHRIFKIDPRTEGMRRAPSLEEMEAAEAEAAAALGSGEPSMLDMAPSAGPADDDYEDA